MIIGELVLFIALLAAAMAQAVVAVIGVLVVAVVMIGAATAFMVSGWITAARIIVRTDLGKYVTRHPGGHAA